MESNHLEIPTEGGFTLKGVEFRLPPICIVLKEGTNNESASLLLSTNSERRNRKIGGRCVNGRQSISPFSILVLW